MNMLTLFNEFDQFKKSQIDGSKYFTWGEALFLQRMNAYVKPTIPQVTNIEKLAARLDLIRDHFKVPITITSWLRPVDYNKLIGGAQFSHHTTGSAVDFTVMGLSGDAVRAELKKHPLLIEGLGLETGIPHVHIQLSTQTIWFAPPQKFKGV